MSERLTHYPMPDTELYQLIGPNWATFQHYTRLARSWHEDKGILLQGQAQDCLALWMQSRACKWCLSGWPEGLFTFPDTTTAMQMRDTVESLLERYSRAGMRQPGPHMDWSGRDFCQGCLMTWTRENLTFCTICGQHSCHGCASRSDRRHASGMYLCHCNGVLVG